MHKRIIVGGMTILLCMLFFIQPSFSWQKSHSLRLENIDKSIKPCQEFYEYANGKWLANTPIPADRSSWGTGAEIYEKNLEVLHQILEDAARNTSSPKGSITQKVGNFYRTGMDE